MKMKQALIVVIVVIILLVGFLVYRSRKSSLTTTTTNSYTTQNDSSGDPVLDADLQDVDKQLNAIDTSSSNADAGLNDQMGDLSSQ